MGSNPPKVCGGLPFCRVGILPTDKSRRLPSVRLPLSHLGASGCSREVLWASAPSARLEVAVSCKSSSIRLLTRRCVLRTSLINWIKTPSNAVSAPRMAISWDASKARQLGQTRFFSDLLNDCHCVDRPVIRLDVERSGRTGPNSGGDVRHNSDTSPSGCTRKARHVSWMGSSRKLWHCPRGRSP